MRAFPLHLIPLLPLLGAAFNLIVGRKLPRLWVYLVGCGSVAGAALVSLEAVFGRLLPAWHIWHSGGPEPVIVERVFTWMKAGSFQVDAAFLLDPLSAVMILTVTIVGLLIHVYSMGYMAHDKDPARFFGYLNLFMGAMLILVLGESLLLLFVGWEGVGLCSYLLIGFWYDKEWNATCGRKAFVVNRIGDFGFLLGMLLTLAVVGTVSLPELQARSADLGTTLWLGMPAAFWIGALLFVGATGKSAQLPLYVWLPDAMAGPTPVSALIHAATMVTAGVYMVARLNFLYALAPAMSAIIAGVGTATAIFAALLGFAQTDIKKVLAYSTISQLGFMFAAVGVGAYASGIFHLFTHAFFKAGLFLGAGSVMHAMGDRTEIYEMGGLRKKTPVTHAVFLTYTLAIAGIVPFAGFFSKDAILAAAFGAHLEGVPAWLGKVYWAGLTLAALGTAFYMFRLYFLVFSGHGRDEHLHEHAHESPAVMTGPLVVLALGAVVLGGLGLPEGLAPNLFGEWLRPVVGPRGEAAHHASLAHEMALAGVALAIAVAGILIAARFYAGGPKPAVRAVVAAAPRLYRYVRHKYYVDEVYDFLFVRPLRWFSVVLHRFVDAFLIDLVVVNGSAWVIGVCGSIARRFQNGDVQRYVVGVLVGVAGILYFATRPPADIRVAGCPARGECSLPALTVQPQAAVPAGGAEGLSFDWEFGDGQTAQGLAPAAHRYAAPGRYEVKLRVHDERWGRTRGAEREIVVGEAGGVR